jgi:hypothetical protein
MFRALLTHPQEVVHKRHLVHWVRVMSVSVGCTIVGLELVQPVDTTHTQFFCQCHHMSLMDFVAFPPGCGRNVTDF